jgi:Putative zinc-finger
MNCELIKSNIPSLLNEELPADERHRVIRHIEECDSCRREMADFEKAWTLMDQWETEGPPTTIKTRTMAFAREELESVKITWWLSLARSFIFQTVLGALGFAMIIYLALPYNKIINLCETLIVNETFLAFFPRSVIYFILGLFYGLIPISISSICFLKSFKKNQMLLGLGASVIFAAVLVPFFILQCPGFEVGLIVIMALGIVSGSLSGGTGTVWVLNRARVEMP